MKNIVSFKEAVQITTESVKVLGTELIDSLNSLGRVLSDDVISDMDMPPFDKSAMDGYACRFEDICNELEVIELIQAGKVPEKKISKNQCSKIMTGAMIPDGADCVLMIEYISERKNNKIQFKDEIKYHSIDQIEQKDKKILNICYQGEDIKSGEVILKKGKLIKAQHIAMMAAVGYTKINVYKQPRIALIPTGNEIVEPHFKPSISEIRNSNGFQIIAQLKNTGIDVNYFGIARDTEKETIELIEKSCDQNDVIILTGGVSKGDFDLVPDILKKLKFNLLFEEVAVQPGRPTVFGVRENKYCFALPGNPVSCFVQLEVLIKPFLNKLMGYNCKPWIIPFPIATDFSRKNVDRLTFIPVNINKLGEAELIEYHGSAHINGYDKAWGIMEVPIGLKNISKGEKVNVRQI
jgi:molybdopterin molybdotransferase